MYANQFSTNQAGPATVFTLYEFTDAALLNHQQVFQHAHAIFLTIPFIEVSQALAGVVITGMVTILPFAFIAKAYGASAAALGIGGQTSITWILLPNISNAKPAIHATGRNFRDFGARFH
jgi:hypothetical protein